MKNYTPLNIGALVEHYIEEGLKDKFISLAVGMVVFSSVLAIIIIKFL